MEGRGFWRLEGVSDSGLQRELMQLLAGGARTEARIVAHIAEVERRRLFLREGFSSVYKYCKVQLGLSEYESFHRMTAASIARKYPVVFALLDERRIHLSGLCKLRDFLTRANHLELLEAACGKTKQQIEELLAVRFPGQKVQDSVRRLPARRIVASVAAPAAPAAPARAGIEHTQPNHVELFAELAARSESSTRSESSARLGRLGVKPGGLGPVANRVELFDPVTGEVKALPSAADDVTRSTEARRVDSREPGHADGVGPSEQPTIRLPRYRVQFDASSELKAKIDLARALSSHSNPAGDLETLFERAIDLYLEHLQKKRFGKTDKPRRVSPSTGETRDRRLALRHPSSGTEQRAKPGAAQTVARPESNRPHVSYETRRQVVAKDGLRCAFVSSTGQRCDEQAFLQLHHEEPWARTMNDQPDNLRLYCASHNRLRAEQDFGAPHIARRIEQSRKHREPDASDGEKACLPSASPRDAGP